MILTGQPIDAAEAYRVGLVNKVVPLPELIATAEEYARIIAEAAPLAVRAAKEAMINGTDMSLAEGLELDMRLFNFLLGTDDFNEGITAFTHNRKPIFKGS